MTVKVYVAGPYSTNPVGNTHTAIWWTNKLLDEGFAPFCPHLSHYLEEKQSRPYQDWLAFDLEWLKPCDVLLRIKGPSAGADKEELFATANGIPIVYEQEYMHGEFLHTDVELTVAMLKDAAQTASRKPKPVVAPEQPGIVTYESGAKRSTTAETSRFDLIPFELLQRVGATLQEGARKYGEYNWQRGVPLSHCINHAFQHLAKYTAGDTSEDHLAHAACNLAFLMYYESHNPDLVAEWQNRFPHAEPPHFTG